MNASGTCLSLIKRSETCRLVAYWDRKQKGAVLSVGWGHTGPDVFEGMAITQQWADWLLRNDVKKIEIHVDRLVAGTPLTQGQYDAIISLVYNIGAGNFADSTLLRKLKAGDLAGAAAEFLRWDHEKQNGVEVEEPGLLARRRTERLMFLGAA